MSATVSSDLTSAIQSLNVPGGATRYAIDGNVVTAWWDFANTDIAEQLFDGGASSAFRYTVTLDPDKRTYRCSEQDEGYNNGRFRKYSGYNRGVHVDFGTIALWFLQRRDRKKRTGSAGVVRRYDYEELKKPLRDLLDSDGWTRKGLIR